MTNFGKILCLILAMCMLASLPAYAAAGLPFDDVAANAWYRGSVQFVYDMGIMSGTADDTFSPNMTTTRGMIVTILHRISGEPEAKQTSDAFTDVTENAYYAKAVAWASESGIVNGYGNGKFGPNDPITREQMASILCRYTDYCRFDTSNTAELSQFADCESISGYAKKNMAWAVAEGLISGMGNDTLAPRGLATRAQVATIIARYLGLEFEPIGPSIGDNDLGWA